MIFQAIFVSDQTLIYANIEFIQYKVYQNYFLFQKYFFSHHILKDVAYLSGDFEFMKLNTFYIFRKVYQNNLKNEQQITINMSFNFIDFQVTLSTRESLHNPNGT